MRSTEDCRRLLAESWRTVRAVEAQIGANTGPVLFSFMPHVTGFARVPESLLLLFATSVLEQALICLRNEGVLRSRDIRLSGVGRISGVAA